jgi:hypothetical protein
MPEQKIILSVISQVSATIKDEDLLAFMTMVRDELSALIMKHQVRDFLEMELPYHEDLVITDETLSERAAS